MNPLSHIHQIDYTVIFARDMAAMRRFYEMVMAFPVRRTLGEGWIEYAVGSTTLALTVRGGLFDDASTPKGALSVQLAFLVPPEQVSVCARKLESQGIALAYPVTDQPWGHRTLFFRDPDGNVLEIYAEI
jgi:catechol 2,3-dioxygenase-like lactoylglutathione lyase family enzyme